MPLPGAPVSPHAGTLPVPETLPNCLGVQAQRNSGVPTPWLGVEPIGEGASAGCLDAEADGAESFLAPPRARLLPQVSVAIPGVLIDWFANRARERTATKNLETLGWARQRCPGACGRRR